MEALQQSPPKIPTTCLTTMQTRLQEVNEEIDRFANLPIDTPSLGPLAQHIQKKLGFIRNMLSAETASYGTSPYDLSEIEERLTELEAAFYRSNVHPVTVHGSGESDQNGSGSASVCESCMNSDRGGDESSVNEAREMLYEGVVPPPAGPEVLYESTVPCSDPLKVETLECVSEISGGDKRPRWRKVTTMAILTTVSAALMVSLSNYLVSNQHAHFLPPT